MERPHCPELERFFTLLSVGIVAGSVTDLQARVKWETVRHVLKHVESGAVRIDELVDARLRSQGLDPRSDS